MGEPTANDPLVDLAEGLLRRLSEVSLVADAARDAALELEHGWTAPLVLGIGGEDLPARTELFNFLIGGRVLDPHARALGCAALQVRRGHQPRFRALRGDRPVEEYALPPEPEHGRAGELRGEIKTYEQSLVEIDRTLPKLLREPPPKWAVWLVPVVWILRLIHGNKLTRRRHHATTVHLLKGELASLGGHVDLGASPDHNLYYDRLRQLSSGVAVGADVYQVEVEVEGGPTPENVEVIELNGSSRASARVDAVVVVAQQAIYLPTGRNTAPIPLGDVSQALGELPSILVRARAVRLGRRAVSKIDASLRALDDAIAFAEADFTSRIERTEALRIVNAIEFAEAQLARMRPQMVESVSAVMEHAAVHLNSELARLRTEWIAAIDAAKSGDELKAAASRIEAESIASTQQIATDVRVLVMGGVGGCVRDLAPDVIASLRPHGLPESYIKKPAVAPALPTVEVLPSLANPTATKKLASSGWLGGLFRSFETRRTELREQAVARAERLREVGVAEFLDAEPQLHTAIGGALVALLTTAIEHQSRALDAMLVAKREQVEQERAGMAPLIALRDNVRRDSARLGEILAQREAVPIVAAAAATSSHVSVSAELGLIGT
jgi:hypothetical protein